MRVFVAGATGVIGRRLLPLLTSRGHEVVGLARSYGAAVEVEMLGAVVAEADALDSDALSRVVKDAAPDAVVHLLTAREADGLVLRLGQLYGHGTIYGRNGSFVRQVQAGKMPIIGSGDGTFSFTHVHDAAAAITAALDSHVHGVLNVVDDEPAPVREWLPILAQLLDAPPPKHVPVTLARLAVGGWGVAFMTQLRGADNTLARRTLDWAPRYSSWRQGFAAELAHATHS